MSFCSPVGSRAAGTGVVHQELRLFPDLTVRANPSVNDEITCAGCMDVKAMRSRSTLPVRSSANRYGLRNADSRSDAVVPAALPEFAKWASFPIRVTQKGSNS